MAHLLAAFPAFPLLLLTFSLLLLGEPLVDSLLKRGVFGVVVGEEVKVAACRYCLYHFLPLVAVLKVIALQVVERLLPVRFLYQSERLLERKWGECLLERIILIVLSYMPCQRYDSRARKVFSLQLFFECAQRLLGQSIIFECSCSVLGTQTLKSTPRVKDCQILYREVVLLLEGLSIASPIIRMVRVLIEVSDPILLYELFPQLDCFIHDHFPELITDCTDCELVHDQFYVLRALVILDEPS